MKKKVGRPKKVKKESAPYRAAIKIMGRFYEASGTTASEAVANIKPDGARGFSVITVSKGEVVQEKILPKLLTARLFSDSALMRQVALKQVCERFSL